jgi:hypothetical protein
MVMAASTLAEASNPAFPGTPTLDVSSQNPQVDPPDFDGSGCPHTDIEATGSFVNSYQSISKTVSAELAVRYQCRSGQINVK